MLEQFCEFMEPSLHRRMMRFRYVRLPSAEAGIKADSRRDAELSVHPGDVISIIGPTGSERAGCWATSNAWLRGDTPTGRYIRIPRSVPDDETRF